MLAALLLLAVSSANAQRPAVEWDVGRVSRAGAYDIGGTTVVVAVDRRSRVSLIEPETGRTRIVARAPSGVRWEGGVPLGDGLLVEGTGRDGRLGGLIDATGGVRWAISLAEYEHVQAGLGGTGAHRMLLVGGGRAQGAVLDMATGAALVSGIPAREVRVDDGEDHWFNPEDGIATLASSARGTLAVFMAREPGVYAVTRRGARRLAAAAGGDVVEVELAGDVAVVRSDAGLLLAGLDVAGARLRWQRSFADPTCGGEYGDAIPCSARIVTLAGREPFMLVETSATATAIAPRDGRVLWTQRGSSAALVFIAGESHVGRAGRSRRVLGGAVDYRWLDPDGRRLAELSDPPVAHLRIQIPVGDDAVLVQADRTLALLGRDGRPRWSAEPGSGHEWFLDDVAGGLAFIRVEDGSTRHLRLVDLRTGARVSEHRDVQPVVAILRNRPTPLVILERMGGGLLALRLP